MLSSVRRVYIAHWRCVCSRIRVVSEGQRVITRLGMCVAGVACWLFWGCAQSFGWLGRNVWASAGLRKCLSPACFGECNRHVFALQEHQQQREKGVLHFERLQMVWDSGRVKRNSTRPRFCHNRTYHMKYAYFNHHAACCVPQSPLVMHCGMHATCLLYPTLPASASEVFSCTKVVPYLQCMQSALYPTQSLQTSREVFLLYVHTMWCILCGAFHRSHVAFEVPTLTDRRGSGPCYHG